MKPKVAFVRLDPGACGYYRIHLPAKTLAAKGWPIIQASSDEDLKAADILVLQRLRAESSIDELTKLKRKGKKIVIDFDDNFFLIEEHNPAKRLYDQKALAWQGVIAELADALTVTTKPLADSYFRFNSNIHVLPNFVDESMIRQQRSDAGPPIVGWQGSSTHEKDLSIVRSVLEALRRRYDFSLVLAGFKPDGFLRWARFRPWTPFADDLAHIRLFADFSVGLCPLEKTAFNECKSDLKFLEYSALGIPTVASKIVTYATIEHGVTGYLARNQKDWEHFLGNLIEDVSLRLKIGRQAQEYVLAQRTIQKNINLWESVYQSL